MAAQAVRAMRQADASERRVGQTLSIAQGDQQQGVRLNGLEATLGDINNMLGTKFEELRLEILQSRREILDSLDQKDREHSLQSSTPQTGPGLSEQHRQQDLIQMKQTLTFIHQEILETRREISKKSAGVDAQEQAFEWPWHSSSMKNGAPASEGDKGIKGQSWQQDLSYMKQVLISIQQDIQALPEMQVQISDGNGTGPLLQKGEQVVRGDDGQNAKGRFAQQVQLKRNQLMAQHGTPQLWSEFQGEVISFDKEDAWHLKMLEKKVAHRGFWFWLLGKWHLEHLLPTSMPDNCLARATQHTIFTSLQTLLILLNSAFMGYETDKMIKATLEEPPAELAQWFETVELAFNLWFAAECLFRIIALRGWFWFAMHEWTWNYFDVLLVTFSLVSDLLATGANVSFIRLLRTLRAVRVVRVIRVLRFFRHLRQMLFAILACLSSLAWSFVFFGMLMFMFSIVFLQGVTDALHDMDWTSEPAQAMRRSVSTWFGSMNKAMLSLLATVTGGTDWLIIKEPLDDASPAYGIAFILYLLFVTVGVMNVLTGIFLSNADEFFDLDLIGQYEQVQAEAFIEQMLQFFHEIDLNHTGEFDWQTFHEAMKHDNLKAFLASMSLEPTHLRLIFDLLDEKRTGKISMNNFLMAILKLKGEAKAVDCRVMLRELSMLPMLLHPNHLVQGQTTNSMNDESPN